MCSTASTTEARVAARSGAKPTPVVRAEGNVIVVSNFAARENESPFDRISLSCYWLPQAPFTTGPMPLTERDDLVEAVKSTIVGYGMRMLDNNKSAVVQVSNAVRAMAKFIEHGWLNGFYKLEDWTPSAALKLAKLLGKGGWASASAAPASRT
jgi:hypothetical protein